MTKKEFIEDEEEIFLIRRNILFIIPMLTFCYIVQNNIKSDVSSFVGEQGFYNALIILFQISIFIVTSFLSSSITSLKKEEIILKKEREKLSFWNDSFRKAKKKGFETFLREIVSQANENKNQKILEHFDDFVSLCVQCKGNAEEIWNCIKNLEKELHRRECEQFKAFLIFYRKQQKPFYFSKPYLK